MSSGDKPCVVRFGEGVSMTHPDDPMAGRFLTEEDLHGGKPVIDAPMPTRTKPLGTGVAESKSGGILTFKEVYAAAARARQQTAVDRFHHDLMVELGQKTAAVDPLARVTTGGTATRGDENHPPLLRNPYAGTPDAANYENGYEHAQQLGHQVLGQTAQRDIARWDRASPAWRSGLQDGARTLGAGNAVATLAVPGKTAMRATMYFKLAALDPATKDRMLDIGGTLAGGVLGSIAGSEAMKHYLPDAPLAERSLATGAGALLGGAVGRTGAMHAYGHRAPTSVGEAFLGLPSAVEAHHYNKLEPNALHHKFAGVAPSDLKHGTDPDSKFDPAALRAGAEVEREHTDEPEVARAIAKGHLAEFKPFGAEAKYYPELDKLEKRLKSAGLATQYFARCA